jgi:hypothetical protein
VELLKELAPRVKRVAVIHHAGNPASAGYLAAITPAASTFAVELAITGVRNSTDIERAIHAIAARPDGGIIVLPGPRSLDSRNCIVALAEQHRPRVKLKLSFSYNVVLMAFAAVTRGGACSHPREPARPPRWPY